MPPKPRVFIHSPTATDLSPPRQAVREAVLEHIALAGFEPQEFRVSGLPADASWSFGRAADVMDACQGAVILALPIYTLEDGVTLPSEYAHYEGALAHAKRLPTMIFTERGGPTAGILNLAGGEFIHRLEDDALGYLGSPVFAERWARWARSVQDRSRVFLGYCSEAQATADALIKFLTSSLRLEVIDWSDDFRPGRSIIEQLTEAIPRCRCGVFLFTRDDEARHGGELQAAPRDNVVLEAGSCIVAKGAQRTIIIREEGAKMPADLGGVVNLTLKDRSDTSPIHERLRQALDAAL